jgi:hypothetical protein
MLPLHQAAPNLRPTQTKPRLRLLLLANCQRYTIECRLEEMKSLREQERRSSDVSKAALHRLGSTEVRPELTKS